MFRSLGFFLLFNRRNSSPSGTSGSNSILVGNRKEISFFDSEFLTGKDNLFHVVEHIFETFSLFGDLGHVDEFVSGV
jgi:hypothetical protein